MNVRGAYLFLLSILSVVFLTGCSGTTSSTQDSTAHLADNSAPTVASVSIEGGTSVYSSSVTLNLSATDDTGVSWYYASESPMAPNASTEWVALDGSTDFSGGVPFTLSDGYGTKTVYVWVKDSNSNMSMAASVSVNRAFLSRTTGTPNVIMIVIDTLRADHTSMHNWVRDTSPHLNEFKNSAVFFENAIAPAPWTTPSFTSLLLAKFSFNHNNNGGNGSVEYGMMLNQTLEQSGYRSVSIQTNTNVAGTLDKGFDEYYDHTNEDGVFPDDKAVTFANEWLNSNRGAQFFMFMGLISPHWSYKPNNGFYESYYKDEVFMSSEKLICEIQYDGITYFEMPPSIRTELGRPQGLYYVDSRLYEAAYDAEINFTDYHINRLFNELKRLGVYDDSLIIITADHGENMTDHAVFFGHGDHLYNSLVHVPLMIKFPGQTEGLTVKEYVRTIDALPTVLDYLSLSPVSGADGKTLLPLINKESVDIDDRPVLSYAVDQMDADVKIVSVVKDGYKLVQGYTDGDRLYDLTNDPGERSNIIDSKPEVVDALREYLGRFYPPQ